MVTSYNHRPSSPTSFTRLPRLRLLKWVIFTISFSYLIYTLNLFQCSPPTYVPSSISIGEEEPTSLRHIVFGIAVSANLWETRKNYIKLWYNPNRTRGIVWLDKPVSFSTSDGDRALLPPLKISANTTGFLFTSPFGDRSAIRISRIISETLALNLTDVRWFVLCDDDTVFLPENLAGVLATYDHRQHYYIGTNSESHLQNIKISYQMAYGGGGFAISYALAVLLSKNIDRCIHRYPYLFGSDERIHACMSELGVPLTRHRGFHQCDVSGEIFGLLAAHPVVPFVSFHHLDLLSPVFPDQSRVEGLRKIFRGPVRLDSAGVMQQSICYDLDGNWTVGISWGFAVQIVKGIVAPQDMELPLRTYSHWHHWSKNWEYNPYAYAFNTRELPENHCERPIVYYLQSSRFDRLKNLTITEYTNPVRLLVDGSTDNKCEDSSTVERMVVYKRPDPNLWSRAPRRNCCRITKKEEKKMSIDVGVCKDEEISMIL